ncbi:MAG TPA: SRPBCC family protein [Oculatellaceae cyanobacterium]|jgi:uncharacterized membrane protein
MHRIAVSVTVDAPVSKCFEQWLQFEQFPKFMRRVASVSGIMRESGERNPDVPEELANTLWHVEVHGPFGKQYGLHLSVDYYEQDKCISWTTSGQDEDVDIFSSGTINFLKPAGEREGGPTLLELTMSYSPNGLFGDLITDLAAYGDNVVEDCLLDFKRHVEAEYQREKDLEIQEGARSAL